MTMASSWRDLLPKVLADRQALAVSSVSSVSSVSGEELGPNRPNGPNGADAGTVAGMQRLRVMRPPPGVDTAVWRRVVDDAVRLIDEGWAASAMALAWTDLDLFGAVSNPDGDPAGDGLAVWLTGRRLIAITADYAVADGDGGRSYFNRRLAAGAVLLWDLTNYDKGNRA